jgi:hypothetical protein
VERVFKAGISLLVLLLLAAPFAAVSHAQSPPLPGPPPPMSQPMVGFVSPYEIMRTIREAGFEPLAPPLRERTDYVLRAMDFRGVLMHVVVDARTGAIRDVTRIVPAPGRYGQFYGGPPYGPDDYSASLAPPTEASIEPPPPARQLAPVPAPRAIPEAAVALPPRPLAPALRAVPETAVALPPLPRPRPATLASRKSDSVYPAAKPLPSATINTAPNTVAPAPVVTPPAASAAVTAKPAATPDAKADTKAQINSEVITAAPPPASAPPKRVPIPVEPLND